MNKYAIIALFACVAVASASHLELVGDELESSASLAPTNAEEVSELTDETRAFSDFCVTSRDFVIGDIKSTSNGFASTVFSILFNSAESIGLEAVNVQRDATDRLAQQIRNPSSAVPEADATNEVDQIIVDAQKSINESPNQPRSFLTGVVGVLSATKNAVTSQVVSRLNQLKDGWKLPLLTNALKGACDKIDAYENDIRAQFESVKESMKDASPALAKLQLQDVQCITSRRIIRLDGLCKFAAATQNPLIKVITYKPIPASQ